MDKIAKLVLILIAIALPAFFLFACISLKPMESISTEVNATIETGSDVCLGFNESTCGALIKEKRILSTGYVCTGAKGPSDYKSCYPDIRYGYLGPTCSASPSCHFVSSNPIEIGRLGFSEYCRSDCSKSTALPDVECKLVDGICRAEIVSDPTTVCKSDANAYNLPINQWNCRKESSSYVMPYPSLSNSTVLSISRDCSGAGFAFFSKDITIYASVPNLAVDTINPSCRLEANCPVSSKDSATGTNIESRIKDLNIIVTGCGTTPIQMTLSPDLRTGYCSLATSPGWYGGNFDCAINSFFLQDSPDKSSKIGAMTYMISGSVLGPCGCTGVKRCEFKLKCDVSATHATTWKCEKTDRSAIYQFTDCQAPSSFSTFQGGEMYLQTGIPYSELSNIMTGYYNGSEQTKQIPFFMVGQGPTFQDFERAREKCNPFEDKFFNVSLGNTTFDPPILTIPEGIDLCFKNIDSKEHNISIDRVGQTYSEEKYLPAGDKKCGPLPLGEYTMTDSSGDLGTIKVLPSGDDVVFFVGSRIVPDYGLATEGKRINFSLSSSEVPEHDMAILPEGTGCRIDTASRMCSLSNISLGEHEIADNGAKSSSKVFVQSQTDKFFFRVGQTDPAPRDASSDDPNKRLSFIARPFGDSICFTAAQELSGICGAIVSDWEDDDGTFCSQQMAMRCFDNVSYSDFSPVCGAGCSLASSSPVKKGEPNFGEYCTDTCIKATDLPGVQCSVTGGNCTAQLVVGPASVPNACVKAEVVDRCIPNSGFAGAVDCQPNRDADKCQFQVKDPQSAMLCNAGAGCVPNHGGIECKKGLYISIFRESEEGAWTTAEKDKEVLADPSYCCFESPIPGYYKADTNDGREVRFLISSNRPTATVNLRGVGFVPPYAAVDPGTQVCWQNPSPIARSIEFLSSTFPIDGFYEVCTRGLDDIGVYTARFSPFDLGVTTQIEVQDRKTYFINILAMGFDPPFTTANPGDMICWKNTDNKNHTLISEDGTSTRLDKNEMSCIQHADSDVYYSRTDNATGVTSVVTSIAGYGMFLTPFGIYPISITVPKSNSTYTTRTAFFNKLASQANFVQLENIIATSAGLQPRNMIAIAPLNITFMNYDNRSHVVTVYGASGGTRTMTIPPGSNSETFIMDSSGSIVDTTLAPTVGAESATTYISTVGTLLTTVGPGQSSIVPMPSSIGTFRLLDRKSRMYGTLTVTEPEPQERKEPIFNETMDLPVQQIAGMITSEQLAKIREYANRGLVPAIIPSFGDQVVRIKTEAFNPGELNVSAGSTVEWENTDNSPHILNFTSQHFSKICNVTSPITSSLFSCEYNDKKRICLTKLIDATRECAKSEVRSQVTCASNGTLAGAVDCRPSLISPTAECEVNIVNPSNAGLYALARQYCDFNSDTIRCSIKPGVDLQGIECIEDVNAPPDFMCSLKTTGYTVWKVDGGYNVNSDSSISWNTSYPFCYRTSRFSCDLDPLYKAFSASAACSYSGGTDSCYISKNDLEDINETYCRKELKYDPPEYSTAAILAKKSHAKENMTGDTIWNITDERSGDSMALNVQSWDVDLVALFRPFQPDLAEVSSDSYTNFQSYMSSNVVLDGRYDSTPISLEVPYFGAQRGGVPGYAIWFPKGSFAYFTNGPTTTSIYVNPPFATTTFNLTLDATGYTATTPASTGKVATMALYPGSQVCVKSADNRHVRVLKDGRIADEGDTFGVLPPASQVCMPVLACQNRYSGIQCSGEINTNDNNPNNDYCTYNVTSVSTGLGAACTLDLGLNCITKPLYESEIQCAINDQTKGCYYKPLGLPESNPACGGSACQAKAGGVTCQADDTAAGKCKFSPISTTGSVPCSGSNCQVCTDQSTCSKLYADVECVKVGTNCYVGPYSTYGTTCSSNQYCIVDQSSLSCTGGSSGTPRGCSPSCSYSCHDTGTETVAWYSNGQCGGGTSWDDRCNVHHCSDNQPADTYGVWLGGCDSWGSCCWLCETKVGNLCYGYHDYSYNFHTCYSYGSPYIGGSTVCTSKTAGVNCYASSYICAYYTASDRPPKKCSSVDACPCLRCSVKYPSSALQNYGCSAIGNKCQLAFSGNGWSIDPAAAYPTNGAYCNYEVGSKCSRNPSLSGIVCGKSGSDCTVSGTPTLDTTGDKCIHTQTTKCDSKDKDVTCEYKDGSCQIKNTPNAFCWTPEKTGEYVLEDVSTGQRLYATVYNRLEPLAISIQRSALVPASATTSPSSRVCMISGDGQPHVISLPPALMSTLGSFINVWNEYTCISLPEGRWALNMADEGIMGTPASSIIASSTKNSTVNVKYSVFDPEFAIMRIGHDLTFTNIDDKMHTVCLADPVYNKVDFASENGAVLRNSSDLPDFRFSEADFPEGASKVLEEYIPGKCGGNGKSCVNNSECLGTGCIGGVCNALTGTCRDSSCKMCTDTSATATWVRDNASSGERNCNVVGGDVCTVKSGYSAFSASCSVSGNSCIGSASEIKSSCPSGTYNKATGKCEYAPTTSTSSVSISAEQNRNEWKCTQTCYFFGVPYCCSSSWQCPANFDPGNPSCSGSLSGCSTSCTTWWTLANTKCYKRCTKTCTCTVTTTPAPTDPTSKALLSNYCNNDCSTKGGVPAGVTCSANTAAGGGCKASISPLSLVCSSSTPNYVISDCTPKSSGVFKCRMTSDKLGCEYVFGKCGGNGKECTNDAICSDAACSADGICVSGPACSDSQCGTCIGAEKIDNALLGRCGKYGSNARKYTLNFTLPSYTLGMAIRYKFNDNGIIFVNDNMLASDYAAQCGTGDMYTIDAKVDVPSGYLKLGEVNKIEYIDCDCGGKRGIDTTITLESIPSLGGDICGLHSAIGCGSYLESIAPGESTIVPDIGQRARSCIFIDKDFQRAFKISVKPCSGSDVTNLAIAINSYERPEYNSIACDSGLLPECSKYNPYGPATISILTSEKGLDLSRPADLACIKDQLVSIKSHCQRCAVALYAGNSSLAQIANVLGNSTVNASTDLVAQSMMLNEYSGKICKEKCSSAPLDEQSACREACGTCSMDNVINEKIAMAKMALYNFSKASIILEMGAKEGVVPGGTCDWTNESINSAYGEFFSNWIPIMAGSGIIGVAQQCYQDPCLALNYYGLYGTQMSGKAWTNTWFKEGCGKYYYEAEGLSPITFSTYETNYSVCDPSRMFALMQQTKCLEGQETNR